MDLTLHRLVPMIHPSTPRSNNKKSTRRLGEIPSYVRIHPGTWSHEPTPTAHPKISAGKSTVNQYSCTPRMADTLWFSCWSILIFTVATINHSIFSTIKNSQPHIKRSSVTRPSLSEHVASSLPEEKLKTMAIS